MGRKKNTTRAAKRTAKKVIHKPNPQFKRAERKQGYTVDHLNEVLRLCAERKENEAGNKPTVKSVLDKYLEEHPDIDIPPNTVRGWVSRGANGTSVLARGRGRPTRIPLALENELVEQVQYHR